MTFDVDVDPDPELDNSGLVPINPSLVLIYNRQVITKLSAYIYNYHTIFYIFFIYKPFLPELPLYFCPTKRKRRPYKKPIKTFSLASGFLHFNYKRSKNHGTFLERAFFLLVISNMSSKRITNISIGFPESRS